MRTEWDRFPNQDLATGHDGATSAFRNCPRCGKKSLLETEECVHCGVIFARLEEGEQERRLGEFLMGGHRELALLWSQVLADYENAEAHQNFVSACEAVGCLPFASHKYGRILEVSPGEEIARSMRQRVVAMISQRYEVAKERGGWSYRVPRFNLLVLFLGSFTTMAAILLPGLPGLAGFGVSILVLSTGLHFFLRGGRLD